MSSISVIVPVYNEAAVVEELLRNLAPLAAEEIILVDGGSTDGTAALIGGRARIISTSAGRAVQMNAGAKAAKGDILLFLHADTKLQKGALEAVRAAMSDPCVAGGNFDIRYAGGDWAARIFSSVNRVRTRFGIFYGDSGIFCRRSMFERLGGYRPWPIMEDYEFARRLRRAGRLAFLEEPIFVSDRRWRKAGLIRTLWSWAVIQSLYSAGVNPQRLARLYRHIR